MFARYLSQIYLQAAILNLANIKTAISNYGPFKSILDVGCWDGQHTLDFATAGKAKKMYGIEPIRTPAKIAQSKGIHVLSIPADTVKWPLPDNSLDCIVSNQVIEHLTSVDKYFSECFRVLKPGGVIVTSTNNLSSLHNLFSILLGWAPFDLANCSTKHTNLGNPLSHYLHQHETAGANSSWTHKCVYTSAWLMDWQKKYGFINLKTYGAGLYPFPSSLGKIFVKYSAFITLVCQKPK